MTDQPWNQKFADGNLCPYCGSMHQLYDDYTDEAIAWQDCIDNEQNDNAAYGKMMNWIRENTGGLDRGKIVRSKVSPTARCSGQVVEQI